MGKKYALKAIPHTGTKTNYNSFTTSTGKERENCAKLVYKLLKSRGLKFSSIPISKADIFVKVQSSVIHRLVRLDYANAKNNTLFDKPVRRLCVYYTPN